MLRHEEKIQQFAKGLIDHHSLPELLTILTIEINRELAQEGPDQLGVSLRGNTLVAYLFKFLAFKFENYEDAFKAFIFQNCGKQLQVYINPCWKLYIEDPKTLGFLGGFCLDTVKDKFRKEVKLAQAIDLNPSAMFPDIDITSEKITGFTTIIEDFATELDDPANPDVIIAKLFAINTRFTAANSNKPSRDDISCMLNAIIRTLQQISKQPDIRYEEKKLTIRARLTALKDFLPFYSNTPVGTSPFFQELIQTLPNLELLQTDLPPVAREPAQTSRWFNFSWPRFSFGNGNQTQIAQPSMPPVTTAPNSNQASDS